MPTVESYLERLNIYFGARYSKDTVNNARSQASRFLTVAGVRPSYSHELLMAYVDRLIKQGYRPRSIKVIMGCIKTLLTANGIPYPLDRHDMHLGLPKGEDLAPMMPAADVAKLIIGVRRMGTPAAPAVALSTVWGLRATEIARAISSGCDGDLLVVQTLKGGEVRTHSVPPALTKVLSFPPYPYGRDAVHHLFDRLMIQCVRPSRPQEGWHAIRRAVVTGLRLNKVSKDTVYAFMGWRRNDMTDRYWHPDHVEIDEEVYPSHPFLPFWM